MTEKNSVSTKTAELSCPIPHAGNETVGLVHGEGGRAMRSFIRKFVSDHLGKLGVQLESDAANLGALDGKIAITTDSFVVSPLFFPGGDIGKLAIHGTINDLAVSGAVPKFLTLSMVIEEGFSLQDLNLVLSSVAKCARECDVQIVTGDTKVVPKGAADGLFINTTGVGVFTDPMLAGASAIDQDAALIVSGPIGNHGVAILCERESLGFDPLPESDSAALHRVCAELHDVLGNDLIAMRDATRGGLAAVLHEWAGACGKTMWIDESCLPISSSTEIVCEILGLDPLFIANEGVFVAVVSKRRCVDALRTLRGHDVSKHAAVIGETLQRAVSPVLVARRLGTDQPLDEPVNAMLPRIC